MQYFTHQNGSISFVGHISGIFLSNTKFCEYLVFLCLYRGRDETTYPKKL